MDGGTVCLPQRQADVGYPARCAFGEQGMRRQRADVVWLRPQR